MRTHRHRGGSPHQPPSSPRTDLPPPGRRLPRQGPAGRPPGTAAVGLRTAPSPAGSKRPGRVQEGGQRNSVPSAQRPVRARSAASAPPPGATHPQVHLPGPTPSQRPPALGPFCRSGAASRPGPEMAAEQRESGLGRAPVRLAGGRSPARESSAAVALVTATGLGKLRPGPAGLRRSARSSGFPQAGVPGSRPRPRARLTRSRARCSPHNQPGAQSRPPLPRPSVNAQMQGPSGR